MRATELTKFDIVIVGSSPIAICYAIENARMKKRVLVVERSKELGGAWKNLGISEVGPIETTCHLLESYPAAYDYLEALTGMKFLPMNPPPIKIFQDGTETPYCASAELNMQFLRKIAISIALGSIRVINRLLPPHLAIKKGSSLNLSVIFREIHTHFKYRLTRSREMSVVKSPSRGLAEFMNELRRVAELCDVQFHRSSCEKITKLQSQWELQLSESPIVSCNSLAITESVVIKEIRIGSKVVRLEPALKEYWHLLVSTASNTTQRQVSYVHLPDHPIFHRVTQSSQSETDRYFLVQTRIAPEDIPDIPKSISELFIKIGILSSENPSEVKIQKKFVDRHVQSQRDVRIPTELIESNLVVLRTIGDLTRNICLNFNSSTLSNPSANQQISCHMTNLEARGKKT